MRPLNSSSALRYNKCFRFNDLFTPDQFELVVRIPIITIQKLPVFLLMVLFAYLGHTAASTLNWDWPGCQWLKGNINLLLLVIFCLFWLIIETRPLRPYRGTWAPSLEPVQWCTDVLGRRDSIHPELHTDLCPPCTSRPMFCPTSPNIIVCMY